MTSSRHNIQREHGLHFSNAFELLVATIVGAVHRRASPVAGASPIRMPRRSREPSPKSS
jgi:hypothetical protein